MIIKNTNTIKEKLKECLLLGAIGGICLGGPLGMMYGYFHGYGLTTLDYIKPEDFNPPSIVMRLRELEKDSEVILYKKLREETKDISLEALNPNQIEKHLNLMKHKKIKEYYPLEEKIRNETDVLAHKYIAYGSLAGFLAFFPLGLLIDPYYRGRKK